MNQPSELDRIDTYVFYASSSFIGGCIGSYIALYHGREYEILSFLAAGTISTISAYCVNLIRGNNHKHAKSALIFQISFHIFTTFIGTVFYKIDTVLKTSYFSKDHTYSLLNTSSFYLFTYLVYEILLVTKQN